MRKSKIGGWFCKVCGLHFRTRTELIEHMNKTNHKTKSTHRKYECTCIYCNKSWFTTKSGFTNHVACCKDNSNRIIRKGHPHSDEMKKYLSEKMKQYLLANPEQHTWKKNSKFSSIPCNDLKKFLRDQNYFFIEESSIIPDRNFAVDICFPDKMIVIEVNGNQHYDLNTMELKPYYKERHDIIESYGWLVIEIPYNKVYSEEFRNSLCRLLNGNSNDRLCSIDYKVDCIDIHKRAKDKRDSHEMRLKTASLKGTLNKNGKLNNNKLSTEEFNHRKNLILNSGVDLSKFGWVVKVSNVTKLSRRQIYMIVNQSDELKSIVFRRK